MPIVSPELQKLLDLMGGIHANCALNQGWAKQHESPHAALNGNYYITDAGRERLQDLQEKGRKQNARQKKRAREDAENLAVRQKKRGWIESLLRN
jgi:hypothetical protein